MPGVRDLVRIAAESCKSPGRDACGTYEACAADVASREGWGCRQGDHLLPVLWGPAEGVGRVLLELRGEVHWLDGGRETPWKEIAIRYAGLAARPVR